MIDATVGGLKGKFMTLSEYEALCAKILANNELIRELKNDFGVTGNDEEKSRLTPSKRPNTD